MKNTDRLHLWMIAPFVMVQLFIGSTYWLSFPGSPWAIHIHFFTVTAWYLLLITQPYFISKGEIKRHRTWGILGFAMAGGVGFTAISMLPNTVGLGRFAEAEPSRMAPFTPEFFYGVALSEFVLGIAFLFAVYQAIVNRHSKYEHATWLVATAFIMINPAVGRGVQNASIILNGFENYFMEIVVVPALISATIIIGTYILIASRHGMLRHRAVIVTVLVNLVPPTLMIFPSLVEPLNDAVKTIFTLRFEGIKF